MTQAKLKRIPGAGCSGCVYEDLDDRKFPCNSCNFHDQWTAPEKGIDPVLGHPNVGNWTWRQTNPKDQMIAVLSALNGSWSNLCEGQTDVTKFCAQTGTYLDQLWALIALMPPGEFK